MAAPKHGALVEGNEYLAVVCPNDDCKSIIPIGPPGEVHSPVRKAMPIGCPFCGKSGDVFVADAEIRTLEVMPPTAQ